MEQKTPLLVALLDTLTLVVVLQTVLIEQVFMVIHQVGRQRQAEVAELLEECSKQQ